ncbi:gem-associated protein 8 isoform X2, partial [Clarias magur]
DSQDLWYTHPVYTRYWQHYQQAMSWYQRHRQAYSKAIQAAYNPALYPVFPTPSCRYTDWQDEETVDRVPTQTRRWKKKEEGNPEIEEGSESSEESELEYDVSKMDITAELRQYFAQTERHKEEL